MLALLATPFISADIKVNDAYSQTTIYLDAPTVVRACENFTVSIKVADAVDLWGCQVKLTWDPALMEFVDVVEGDFLKTGGLTIWGQGQVTSKGWVLITVHLEMLNSVSGSGTLANVTLHCTGSGGSALNLVQTRLFSPPQSVPWNGYGDFNGDGQIDIFDLACVATHYGSSIGDPGYNPGADFNSDGFVDYFDLLCSELNYGQNYPDPVLVPVEFAHIAMDGWIVQKAEFPVTWRWVNGSDFEDVWYAAYVGFECNNLVQDFNFTQPLDYISFNILSTDPGYCNATIPKLFMSGAFQVLSNNTLTPSIITWNRTHTSIYFTYDQGTHNIQIRGEIATKIRGLWQLSDVNGDGLVDIFDIVTVALDFSWEEP
jgi:hypothetical protein